MPVKNRNMLTFYALILTQTFSLIGSRISGLAIGIWVFGDTGSATPLALVAFFTVLPMVLASSVSGVMADRWDRRYVMVLADAGQAVGTLLLLISFVSGQFELWHLYTIAAIQAIFGVFQGPAFNASVTMLIPDEQRDRANAIQQLTGPMAGIISPTIAALIYAAAGVAGAILVDLMTFVVAMIVVFMIRIPRPTQTDEGKAMQGSIWKEALGGLRYLFQRRVLFFIMLYASLINFIFSFSSILTTPYVLLRLDYNEVALGGVLSVMNLGAVVGGIIIGVWGGTRPRMRVIVPALIVSGVFMAAYGTAQTVTALAAILFMMMLPMPIINALFMSIIQVKTPPDIQGRVFAVLNQMSMLLMPLAYLLAGPLADQVFEPAVGGSGWATFAPLVGSGPGAGIGLIMMVCGLMLSITTTLVFMVPNLRNMERILPDYVPPEHITDRRTITEELPAVNPGIAS